MKVLDFLRNRSNILIIAIIVISLIMIGTLLIVLTVKPTKEKHDEKVVAVSDYVKLFEKGKNTVVFQYANSNNCTYEEALAVIKETNNLLDTNFLVVKKSSVSKKDLESVNDSADYDTWKDTNELIIVSDGTLSKEYGVNTYFTASTLEDNVIKMISEDKLVSEEKLNDVMNVVTLNNLTDKVKNETNTYILFGNNIYDSLYTLYPLNKANLNFYYLDYSKLSSSEIKRLVDTNEKFSMLTNTRSTLTYVFDKDNVELNSWSDSVEANEGFLEEMKVKVAEVNKTSLIQSKLMDYIRIFDYLPNDSILDFASYNDNSLKAKMVLDKMDYLDRIVVEDENGNATVDKTFFDVKARDLFGENVMIDLATIDSIQSGDSCAHWSYNSQNSKLSRGNAGCGGDEGVRRESLFNNFTETDSEYIVETRDAFIDVFNGQIYADADYKILLTTYNNSGDADNAVKSVTDKLYTYKYTFVKGTKGFYLKSYEITKETVN